MARIENIVGEGENDGYQHFPPFPTMFSSFPKQACCFACLQYKYFENRAGIGEIAYNKQFLIYPQCFLLF